jgi:uncharacterized protein YcsI (UPF0317 family)
MGQGYVHTNLVVLRERDASDFLLYAQRNPKACPIVEITEPGVAEPRLSAPGADLRTDLGQYVICKSGVEVGQVAAMTSNWSPDSVAFLIGSSVSFDYLLEQQGISCSQVWVLDTTLPTVPAGQFRGSLVVTMRWMTAAQAILATGITSRFPLCHGAPVHIGDPAAIGANLAAPLFGPPVEHIPPEMTPVFWACGVTPRRAALTSRIDHMITHAAGYAFVTDLIVECYSV